MTTRAEQLQQQLANIKARQRNFHTTAMKYTDKAGALNTEIDRLEAELEQVQEPPLREVIGEEIMDFLNNATKCYSVIGRTDRGPLGGISFGIMCKRNNQVVRINIYTQEDNPSLSPITPYPESWDWDEGDR